MKYSALLLNAQVDLNKKDKLGATFIHMATEIGITEIIEMLIKAKVNINIQDQTGNTPIMLAITFCTVNVVKTITEEKSLWDSNHKIKSENTKFVNVCGFIEIVKLLINAGANVNLKNKEEMTALGLAKGKRQPKIVNLLLRVGAIQ